jgi:hypothetical protein
MSTHMRRFDNRLPRDGPLHQRYRFPSKSLVLILAVAVAAVLLAGRALPPLLLSGLKLVAYLLPAHPTPPPTGP